MSVIDRSKTFWHPLSSEIVGHVYQLPAAPPQPVPVDDDDCETVSDQHPVIMHNDITTNERGGKQAKLATAYDCLSPNAMRLLGECLAFGKAKYGKDNCYKIDLEDHIAHAINHFIEYQCGDRSELHLVNAMARAMFALHMSIEKGETPQHYTHPDLGEKAVQRG